MKKLPTALIQALQKQQFVNYLITSLKIYGIQQSHLRRTAEFYFLYFTKKNMWNMQSSLANQSAHIFAC